ncbi:MAG: GEVED domain-containing protein [Salinivirgaceae bacterium]|jgi:hypothetical protein|nr:GEVED domain-containing protein [Salinivirgaceae bacterium]
MRTILIIVLTWFFVGFSFAQGQVDQVQKATWVKKAESMHIVPSIASKIKSGDFIPAENKVKEFNPKRAGINKVVPGKGLPVAGDPLVNRQMRSPQHKGVEPIFTFDAVTAYATPTDPTGAVGPNHFVNAWNSSFRIWDREGNPLTDEASLSNIWAGQSMGDPIVFYDQFADRFVVTQFYSNGFLVAVTQGPDPLNDGWYTYQFPTNTFPDYPKYSIWSDGYYITANKDQSSPQSSEVVFALDREAMIAGDVNAQIVAFSLPGIAISGFYSPLGFSVSGFEMPPAGNAPIVYMQDDSWSGVSNDHLKIWNINVDWSAPANSTISTAQQLDVTPFDGVFDGGSFSNLPQPSGSDIDALQATIMYMAGYRRFPTHNSALFNFAVDLDGNDDLAGIRWYELRQDNDGDNWEIYQEGTYAQPDGHSAFSGNMAMDAQGNIALAYTVVSSTINPALRYTGRYASDPNDLMTIEEQVIVDGTSSNPSTRYGDYSQMTIDPTDDLTFWSIGEYFSGSGRKNRVGVFKLAPDFTTDIGMFSIDSPSENELGEGIPVTITIRNYGTESQENFTVGYRINGGTAVTEVVTETLEAAATLQHTFATTADFPVIGNTYELEVYTALGGDENTENDMLTIDVIPSVSDDLGVKRVSSPSSEPELSDNETIRVLLENYGENTISDVDMFYILNDEAPVGETITTAITPGQIVSYAFNQKGDFSAIIDHQLRVYIDALGDDNPENDTLDVIITNSICQPQSDCSTGYGIDALQLGTIDNVSECSSSGYSDFTEQLATMGQGTTNNLTISTGVANVNLNVWIDLNDNFVYEANELLVDNYVLSEGETGTDLSDEVSLVIPETAPMGEHLMRVKTSDEQIPASACEATTYGETEDYKVLVDDGISAETIELASATLKIRHDGNNQFVASMKTAYGEKMNITIHDVSGRLLLFNRVVNSNGVYEYSFDMSHVSKGVYLVRMGTLGFGKVQKIVVN